jgi:hypothetical protein
MRTSNPSLPLLELVVATLGPLCPRFVFVGGCVTGLLITEAASLCVPLATSTSLSRSSH